MNEKRINREIEKPLSEMVSGIVESDAQLIFGIFSDPVKARYVRDGAVYKNLSSAEKNYARMFAGQESFAVTVTTRRTMNRTVVLLNRLVWLVSIRAKL